MGEAGILWSTVGMSEELTDHETRRKEEHKKVLIKEHSFLSSFSRFVMNLYCSGNNKKKERIQVGCP